MTKPRVSRVALVLVAVLFGMYVLAVLWNQYELGKTAEHDAEWSGVGSVGIQETDHVSGRRDAPIQMIVYSDPECPVCKYLYLKTLPALRAKYGDDLVVAYRHFLLPRYKKSPLEAQAMECAALVGGERKFWEYATRLFQATPSEDGLDQNRLPELARDAGLDLEKFTDCINQRETVDKVAFDVAQGAVAGVIATPTTLLDINGQRTLVVGGHLDKFELAIEYLRRSQTEVLE